MQVISLFIAGGVGKRLWPKSDSFCPKQFSDFFCRNRTLIEESISRMSFLTSLEDTFVVTDKKFESFFNNLNLQIPRENIIYEPFGKNTSPAIELGLRIIRNKYGDDVVVAVLPCDHFIEKLPVFQNTILIASEYAYEHDAIVTIGINPSEPNTNFGYIKKGGAINDSLFKVESFVEKPDLQKATMYLSSKQYFWNSGIYIFKLSTMMTKIAEKCPFQHSLFEGFNADSVIEENALLNIYNQLENVSIDKGVIEKCDNLFVVDGKFVWDDLGTWNSIEKYFPKDINKNVLGGGKHCLIYDCENTSLISYDTKEIVLCGLDDVMVINANDKLLIIKKTDIEKIPVLIDELKKQENGK